MFSFWMSKKPSGEVQIFHGRCKRLCRLACPESYMNWQAELFWRPLCGLSLSFGIQLDLPVLWANGVWSKSSQNKLCEKILLLCQWGCLTPINWMSFIFLSITTSVSFPPWGLQHRSAIFFLGKSSEVPINELKCLYIPEQLASVNVPSRSSPVTTWRLVGNADRTLIAGLWQ